DVKKAEQKETKESEELKSELDELKEKLNAKDKEAAEFKDKYLRAVADFRNLQESTKREIQQTKEFAISRFAKDLLDSVDNLERALALIPKEKIDNGEYPAEFKDVYEGIEMTQHVLHKTLEKHGMTRLHPLDEPFDPHRHEAMFEVHDPKKEPGTVCFVQQSGYALKDRVLRAAKVGVVK
ncbi:hypothetical protein CANCADRAFT_15902, partial [Tortispora caseinolytica NRRL Y-17796]